MLFKKIFIPMLMLSSFSFSSLDDDVKILDNALANYTNKESQLKTFYENESNRILKSNSIFSGKSQAALNIATKFDYYKTSMYEIFTKPNYTTTIKLAADETLTYIGGGNTEEWDLDEVIGGNDNSQLIFIKPLFENTKTNLTIVTNKRLYNIILVSTDAIYNPFVEFNYPYEQNMNFVKRKLATTTSNDEVKLAVKDATEIDFNYSYDKNSKIGVNQVYSDGLKTIIVLKENFQEAPIVYVYNQDNELTQINYRIISNKIIIDKVVEKVQLILGKTTLNIVHK